MKQANDSLRVHWFFLFFLLGHATAFGGRASAQTAEKIPLPEYYGIYAVGGGKLLAGPRIVNANTGRVKIAREWNPSSNSLPGSPGQWKESVAPLLNVDFAEIATVPPNVSFLVFLQPSGISSSMKVASHLQVLPLRYLRSVHIEGTSYSETHPRGLEINNIIPINAWHSAGVLNIPADVGKQLVMKPMENFLVKPVPNQPEMVMAVPPSKLSPGVYEVKLGGYEFGNQRVFLIAVGPLADAETLECVDFYFSLGPWRDEVRPCMGPSSANRSEAPRISEKSPIAEPGGRQPSTAGTTQPAGARPPISGPMSSVACIDYEQCMREGLRAIGASQWRQSLGYFEKASSLDATKPAPWDAMGTVYMVSGRYQEFERMEDKALELGGPIAFGVCRERPLWCDKGVFSLGPNEVFFADSRGKKIFTVPLKGVDVQGVSRNSAMPSIYFRLRAGSTNYNFDFIPLGVECQPTPVIQCPDPGLSQQLAVGNYITRTIPKLASGIFGGTNPKPALSSSGAPSAAATPSSGFVPPAGTLETGGYLGWLQLNPDFGPKALHLGVDFRKNVGDPVFAIADGEIVLENREVGSYGGVGSPGGAMIIKFRSDTGQSFYGLYGHVENMKAVGPVKKGERVGTVGHYYQRDRTDTPHLHFGVYFGEALPDGDKWPWRQYIDDVAMNPGWQDPLFVLRNLKPGPYQNTTGYSPSVTNPVDANLVLKLTASQQRAVVQKSPNAAPAVTLD